MIPMLIFMILLLIVMELNKNTVVGWILVMCVFAAYVSLWKRQPVNRMILNIAVTAVLILCYILSQPPIRRVAAFYGESSRNTDVVAVHQGKLTGVQSEDGTVELFAGIPYAKPPVGDLRWKAPEVPDSWEGVKVCDTFAPMSMQPSNGRIVDSLAQIIGYHDYKITLKDNFQAPMSEDSLYLNIWRPANATENERLPVIVYIHGGSLMTGQPWYADYAGTGLAKAGVITVNMGYRLGVFGFYGNEELQNESSKGETGNYGLLDQIQALKWVQENIASFGGDPSNVTLAGESAGAACVSALCTSPAAKGLFRRAILESSTAAAPVPAHSFRSLADTLAAGKELYAKTGKMDLAGLRSLSAEQLVKYTNDHHHITVDGFVLKKTPYEYVQSGELLNAEQILHGYNEKESKAFMLFDRITKENFSNKLVDYCKGFVPDEAVKNIQDLYTISDNKSAASAMEEILTGLWFGYGHYCLTQQALNQEVPVWEYHFSQENGRLGSWHSGEEVYCYGTIPADSQLYDKDDRILSSVMLTYWSNFAKTGNPNGGKIFDRYDLWENDEDIPDLPIWNPCSDDEHVASFVVQDGVFIREIGEPLLPLYHAFEGK